MAIDEQAISFAALSLAKVVAAELLRKGLLDRTEFQAAISEEIERHHEAETSTTINAQAAALLAAAVDGL